MWTVDKIVKVLEFKLKVEEKRFWVWLLGCCSWEASGIFSLLSLPFLQIFLIPSTLSHCLSGMVGSLLLNLIAVLKGTTSCPDPNFIDTSNIKLIYDEYLQQSPLLFQKIIIGTCNSDNSISTQIISHIVVIIKASFPILFITGNCFIHLYRSRFRNMRGSFGESFSSFQTERFRSYHRTLIAKATSTCRCYVCRRG